MSQLKAPLRDARYPLDFPRERGILENTEVRSFARAMQFPSDIFDLSPSVSRELKERGSVRVVTLAEALDPCGDLRQHLNKSCNHHHATYNLAALRAGLDMLLSRRMTYSDLAEVVTAYTCFQGFHEGVTLEDWPKDKQWKGREAGGAFRDMVKMMVAPRNRKMVEEKTDVPGVGKVGPPIVKKDWGPIRLTVMQALKMAGRVGAPGDVRDKILALPMMTRMPNRLHLPEFLKIADQLPRLDWNADLADTDIFLDFATTVPLYSLVNFEFLLRPPDERRNVRMSADHQLHQVQRAALHRQANDALREARITASAQALGGSPPPPKPTDGGPKALWKFAAQRALLGVTTPKSRRRSSGSGKQKRLQSVPSTLGRPREFGPGKRRDPPSAPSGPLSYEEARSAQRDFASYYNDFKGRLERSPLPAMQPAERAASKLDDYLSVQGIDPSMKRLVTNDDVRESETTAEDLRWEILMMPQSLSPASSSPADYQLWQNRPQSATSTPRPSSVSEPRRSSVPKLPQRPATATPRLSQPALQDGRQSGFESDPPTPEVVRKTSPTRPQDSQTRVKVDTEKASQSRKRSKKKKRDKSRPRSSRVSDGALTSTEGALHAPRPPQNPKSDRAGCVESTSSQCTAEDWDTMFPKSEAALKAQEELTILKAEQVKLQSSMAVVRRDWRQRGAWVDTIV